MSSPLNALYRKRPINLWVEDEVTREYLREAWQDNDIELLLAGGADNIQAVVEDSGLRNVFGYRDRDFTPASNRTRWADPSAQRVLVSEVFEAENFLFDEEAIAASSLNTSRRTAAQIDAEMQRLAATLSWWLSCRSVIAWLSREANRDFVSHPKRAQVTNKAQALAHLTDSNWVGRTAPGVPGLVDEKRLDAQLVAEEQRYAGMIPKAEWRIHFPGKEILRALVPCVWPNPKPGTPWQARQVDFAKAVARAQVRMGRVPSEVTDLRAALRARVGWH